MPKVASLEDLLIDELRDLYDAEKQLVRALPKMAKAATYPDLKAGFLEHLEVTRNQVSRLEQVFELLQRKAKGKPCKAMKGLIEEGQEIMEEDLDETLLDTALITAGQKVEHYEIAAYGNARTLATAIGRKDVAELLQQTLDEEGETDKKLTAVTRKMLREHFAELKREASSAAYEEETASARARRSAGSASNGSSSRRAAARQASSGGRAVARQSKPAQSRASASPAKAARSNGRRHAARGNSGHPLTDHDQIRSWAEERGAHPACVRGTGNKGDIGMIRLDFPGYSGETSLEPIEWEEWFSKFDENGLALLVQDATARGQKSNFNKLVKRER